MEVALQNGRERLLRRPATEAACNELQGEADQALEVLEAGFKDATAVLTLPAKYRRRLRTTNMVERFIEEIRRRETVIRIFPNLASARRPIGALCAEQHEEWSTGRRYLIMDKFFEGKSQLDTEPTRYGAGRYGAGRYGAGPT